MSLLLMLCAPLVSADTMRCQHKLIQSGDDKLDVLDLCGEPDLKEQTEIDVEGYALDVGPIKVSARAVEKWYYRCGAGRFKRILVFEAGELTAIESGKRGLSGPHRCN